MRSNLAHPRPGTREARALELLLSYSFFYCPRLRLVGAERASRIRWIYGEAASRTPPTASSLRRYAARKRPNKKKERTSLGGQRAESHPNSLDFSSSMKRHLAVNKRKSENKHKAKRRRPFIESRRRRRRLTEWDHRRRLPRRHQRFPFSSGIQRQSRTRSGPLNNEQPGRFRARARQKRKQTGESKVQNPPL